MRDIARDLAEIVDTLFALLARLVLRPRQGGARHREQEPRIDAVVASLDAFAREHAGIRPFARRLVAFAEAQDVERAGDHRTRFSGNAAGIGHRAGLDAFAALGAGVDHLR